jgi:hypothetical protein
MPLLWAWALLAAIAPTHTPVEATACDGVGGGASGGGCADNPAVGDSNHRPSSRARPPQYELCDFESLTAAEFATYPRPWWEWQRPMLLTNLSDSVAPGWVVLQAHTRALLAGKYDGAVVNVGSATGIGLFQGVSNNRQQLKDFLPRMVASDCVFDSEVEFVNPPPTLPGAASGVDALAWRGVLSVTARGGTMPLDQTGASWSALADGKRQWIAFPPDDLPSGVLPKQSLSRVRRRGFRPKPPTLLWSVVSRCSQAAHDEAMSLTAMRCLLYNHAGCGVVPRHLASSGVGQPAWAALPAASRLGGPGARGLAAGQLQQRPGPELGAGWGARLAAGGAAACSGGGPRAGHSGDARHRGQLSATHRPAGITGGGVQRGHGTAGDGVRDAGNEGRGIECGVGHGRRQLDRDGERSARLPTAGEAHAILWP